MNKTKHIILNGWSDQSLSPELARGTDGEPTLCQLNRSRNDGEREEEKEKNVRCGNVYSGSCASLSMANYIV